MTLDSPLVTPDWLTSHLDDVIVCDTRWYLDGRSGRAAYESAHLPGARFVDLDTDLSAPAGPGGRHPLPSPDAFAAAMSRLGIGNDATVIAYDDAGGMVAGRMWWMLDSLGVRAAVLDGGIQAWPGELSVDEPVVTPAVFEAAPWPPTRFVTADEVADRDAGIVLLDARSAERFRGEENAVDPRFGHIPGARSAPFGANLDEGRFRSSVELQSHYADLGIDAETPVMAYCGSGVSACNDLIALRSLGVEDLRLYVGSWSEWGADDERPLEAGD